MTDEKCDRCGRDITVIDGVPTKIKWETGHGSTKFICVSCADDVFTVLDMTTRMVYCFGHGRYEEEPPHTFRVCGECLHVYETAKDLLDLYNKEGRRLHAKTFREEGGFEIGKWKDKEKVSEIQFCPVCLHDF